VSKFNYSSTQATADRLITKFGQSVVITNKSAGAYDPSTGTSSSVTTTQNAVAAIFDRGSNEIDGTLILTGDKKMLFSAVGITKPEINDTVLVGSVTYTIKDPIKELNPAGTVIMYECNLRA